MGLEVNPAAGDNAWIGERLREMGLLLEAQGANPYRAAAYRNAADTVTQLDHGVREIFDREGPAGLDALPGIGPRITAAIGEMLATGAWGQLERLRGDADPDALGRVDDWVVLYGEDPAHGERQYTVVTATHGLLAGYRVVRGREAECRAIQRQ